MPADVVADRLAIADLVHGYAQRVDRRDTDALARLFTDDATFVAYATPGAEAPTTRRRGRDEIARSIGAGLRRYRATSHTIGNHLATVDGDRARGETRCVAAHVLGEEGAETLLVWHLRYLDRYRRGPQGWQIESRELRVDVVSEGPLNAR